MPFNRQGEVFGSHANTIIADTHHGLATGCGDNVNTRRLRVDGVFNQFLDDTGGALHHLAGGDAVDGSLR